MNSIDYQSLTEEDSLLIELPHDVWLMDNHKWALLAWERHRAQAASAPYALIHADFHWDGVDDFAWDEDARRKLAGADLTELEAMTFDDEFIRYDSFIAPAIRRGTVSEVHFFCYQDDGTDEGISGEMCAQLDVSQTLHEDVEMTCPQSPYQSLRGSPGGQGYRQCGG